MEDLEVAKHGAVPLVFFPGERMDVSGVRRLG